MYLSYFVTLKVVDMKITETKRRALRCVCGGELLNWANTDASLVTFSVDIK